MIIKNGQPNTLQLFALDSAGAPVAQIAPWPKVTISRVSAPAADLVVGASMTINAAGEFVYAWTPATVGQYRAKYEMKNGAVSVFAYEDLDAQDILSDKTGFSLVADYDAAKDAVQAGDARLANLDATISSRLAAADYVPPTNAWIVYGTGTDRQGKEVGNIPTLLAQFTRAYVPTDPFSVGPVEIYPTLDDALASTNMIERVAAITNVGTGLYSHALAAALDVAGTYWEKWAFVDTNGGSTAYAYTPFYMRKTSSGIVPSPAHEVAEVVLRVYGIPAGVASVNVMVQMNAMGAIYGKDLVLGAPIPFPTDENGQATLLLTETDTMTLDSGMDIYYSISVKETDFVRKVKVPAGTLTAMLMDLPTV